MNLYTALTATHATWTHPRTGEARIYLDDWHRHAGIDISYYRTGNVSSASVDGVKVSNREAASLPTRVYVTEDGQLHTDEVGRKSPLTAEQICTRVAAALTAQIG